MLPIGNIVISKFSLDRYQMNNICMFSILFYYYEYNIDIQRAIRLKGLVACVICGSKLKKRNN